MSPLVFFIRKYLFGNTGLLLLLVPVFTFMIVSKVFNLKVSIYTAKLADSALNLDICMGLLLKLGISLFLYSLFDELFSLIALGPIFEITRKSNVKFLEIILHERDLSEYRQGEIARSLIRGSESISTIIELSLLEIFPVLIVVFLSFFRFYDSIGLYALFINIGMLFIYTSLTILITKYRIALRRKRNKYEDIAYSQALENIRNIDTIITYKTEQSELSKFDETNKQIKKYHIRLDQVLAILNFVQSVVLYSSLLIFLYYNLNTLSREKLVEYITLSLNLYYQLDKVGCIYHRFCKLIVDLKCPFMADIVQRIQARDLQEKLDERSGNKTGKKNEPVPLDGVQFLEQEEMEAELVAVNKIIRKKERMSRDKSLITSDSGKKSVSESSFIQETAQITQENSQDANLKTSQFGFQSEKNQEVPKKEENKEQETEPNTSKDPLNVTDSLNMFDRPVHETTYTQINIDNETGEEQYVLNRLHPEDSSHTTLKSYNSEQKLEKRGENFNEETQSKRNRILDSESQPNMSASSNISAFNSMNISSEFSPAMNLTQRTNESQFKEPVVLFNNVGIHYNKKRNLAHQLSLSIFKGEKIAVIGPNGTGKSSIIKSLLGFVPISGKISISKPLNLVYASQDTHLFNNTVFNNLTYGLNHLSIEKVINIANSLQIHERLQRIGYNTVINECGRNLSGGQKQAIVILRSVLKSLFTEKEEHKSDHIEQTDANCGKRGCRCDRNKFEEHGFDENVKFENVQIENEEKDCAKKAENGEEQQEDTTCSSENEANLEQQTDLSSHSESTCSDEVPQSLLILDEATSAIDKHTESIIISNLFAILDGVTILFVIHNLSYLKLFDKIIFIGKEIEIGTFTDLKQKNGLFKEFWDKSRQRKEKRDSVLINE